MDLKTYESLVKSESVAYKFVLGFCWKNQQRFCPFCRCRKCWKLSDGRRRCQRCLKTYHDLTARWWNQLNIRIDDWLRIVKLFELELSARRISEQTGLAYNTVHKALMILRHAIVVHAEDAEQLMTSKEFELDESYFGGKRKGL